MPSEVDAIHSAYHADHFATVVHLAEPWLESHPDDLPVTCWYAISLGRMANYEQAAKVFRSALERFEKRDARHALYLHFGSIEKHRGCYSESDKWFHEAILTRPDDATPYIFLATSFINRES